jgi:hypothetical protein
MTLVLGLNSIGVNGNHQNKLTFRIYQGVVSSSFGPFGPCNVSRLLKDMSGGHWMPIRIYNQ